jgi:hypothetical protein
MSMWVSLATAAVLASAIAGQAPVVPEVMPDLAVPPDRLPVSCTLAPRSISLGNNRVMTLWQGFPANPWRGTEPSILATIRTHMGGIPPSPDGPPLSGAVARTYFLKFSEDIDEGFVALYYAEADASMVTVYGLRVANPDEARRPTTPKTEWIRLGSTVAMVAGKGACFDAIETYVDSLAK